MSRQSIQTVRYRERQVLTVNDLRDEQAQRMSMRRRHLIGGHRWGIVSGLTLDLRPQGVVLLAGLAVDGYGRELIVPEDVLLPVKATPGSGDAFDQLETNKLSVWLLYNRVAESPATTGDWPLGPGLNTRWHEEALLRLLPARDPEHPRQPDEVPDNKLQHGPQDPPYPDPADEWPVYLGLVERTAQMAEPPRAESSYFVQAGLVGERVTDPAGEASLQIGEDGAADLRRFAASTRVGPGSLEDRICIDNQGSVALNGNTFLKQGDLLIAAGKEVEKINTGEEKTRAWGVAIHPLAAPPATATPWQVYRTPVKDANTGTQTDDLRLEFFNPGQKGDPRRYRLLIGRRTDGTPDTELFEPCLSVDANCQVTIHGRLYVLGQVIESPISVDPTDPRFGANIFGNWQDAVTKAGDALADFYKLLKVEIDLPATITAGDTINYSVIVTNVANTVIGLFQVGENVTAGGNTLRAVLLPAAGNTIQPNDSLTLNPSALAIPASATGKLVVGVVAVGGRQSGGFAAGMGTTERVIQPDDGN